MRRTLLQTDFSGIIWLNSTRIRVCCYQPAAEPPPVPYLPPWLQDLHHELSSNTNSPIFICLKKIWRNRTRPKLTLLVSSWLCSFHYCLNWVFNRQARNLCISRLSPQRGPLSWPPVWLNPFHYKSTKSLTFINSIWVPFPCDDNNNGYHWQHAYGPGTLLHKFTQLLSPWMLAMLWKSEAQQFQMRKLSSRAMLKIKGELEFKLAFMWSPSSYWLPFHLLKTVIHALNTSRLLINFTCLHQISTFMRPMVYLLPDSCLRALFQWHYMPAQKLLLYYSPHS